MQAWKNLGKNIGISLIILIFGTFLISLFSFIDLLKGNTLTVSKFLIPLLSFFIGSYMQGKSSKQKGFIEGLKVGGILIFILFIFNYGIYQTFKLKNILYYILLLFIAMAGGIVGISRKKEKK